MHIYLRQICYVYIIHLFIYNRNYMKINIHTCKYFLSVYCMCMLLYINNKYTQYTHIYYINRNFILEAINHNYQFGHIHIYTVYIYIYIYI